VWECQTRKAQRLGPLLRGVAKQLHRSVRH
jgi:hypothetical protein